MAEIVTFLQAKSGGPMAKVGRKISFPECKGGKTANVGETWKVEVIGTNPGETVNFLQLIEKIEPQEPTAVQRKEEAGYDRSADKRGSGGGYGGPRQKHFSDGQRGRVGRAMSESELQLLEHQHRSSRKSERRNQNREREEIQP